MGQNQRFARLKVAAVEHDQGAAVGRPARNFGAKNATLQPSAVKCEIVGTESSKIPAKRSLEKSAHGLRIHRGKLDMVDHIMPWFEDVMHGCDLPELPDFGRMLNQPDGSRQFAFAGNLLPVYDGHKKKRRFRASFSVLQLKDELELCVGAITQRVRSGGNTPASDPAKP